MDSLLLPNPISLLSFTATILLLFYLLKLTTSSLLPATSKPRRLLLPPSPPILPILGNLLHLLPSFATLAPTLRRLHSEAISPILTLHVASRPAIFIASRQIAYQTLVQRAAAFAHRPPSLGTGRAFRANCHAINTAPYGPRCRLLRRNLSRLHPPPHALRWALDGLLDDLKAQSCRSFDGVVVAGGSFRHAIFRFLTLLCFGSELDDRTLEGIDTIQSDILSIASPLAVFHLLPKIAMVVFWKKWRKLVEISDKQDELLLPLIRARRRETINGSFFTSYVDSLLGLRLPEEEGGVEREVSEDEMISLCTEFLNAGTETTSTALVWIMANLVKHQQVQERLFGEIKGAGDSELDKMPCLKAVILEGLRRHPPAHFLLPHTVSKDVEVEGYVIPGGAVVNYEVAEIGMDEKVWREPAEFRPERFLAGGEGEGVDVMVGGGEMKMMPFGAGRRACPGAGLATMLLRYLVSGLVREFRWEEVEGATVDTSEEPGLVVAMKTPFRSRILPRYQLQVTSSTTTRI